MSSAEVTHATHETVPTCPQTSRWCCAGSSTVPTLAGEGWPSDPHRDTSPHPLLSTAPPSPPPVNMGSGHHNQLQAPLSVSYFRLLGPNYQRQLACTGPTITMTTSWHASPTVKPLPGLNYQYQLACTGPTITMTTSWHASPTAKPLPGLNYHHQLACTGLAITITTSWLQAPLSPWQPAGLHHYNQLIGCRSKIQWFASQWRAIHNHTLCFDWSHLKITESMTTDMQITLPIVQQLARHQY